MRIGRLIHAAQATGLAAIVLAAATPTLAQEARPNSEFSITPYIWIPGISGNVGAAADLPPVPVEAEFPKVFDKLDGFGMIQGEARYGRFGVLGDYVSFKISGDHNVQFQHLPAVGGNIEVSSDDATLAGFWRAYESDRYTADLLVGARYSELESAATITLGNRTATGSAKIEGWDPIVGARGTMRTGEHGSLSAYGDFGGGGFADSVWQAIGAYNWRFTDHIAGSVGWRFYGVNPGANQYDVTLSGPVIGAIPLLLTSADRQTR